ncbi:DinB family protein [Aureisphaera galaxeae]|uniref:DinB family protein n=1 Tax=Aureisphaera galaxeae TaxID=1538023 RepID=UPI002350C0F2|nr:DinB family protein [Aureisphaera galaxeae]MDC8003880.1 DinB family protein [Aureisphaera galaxeae]
MTFNDIDTFLNYYAKIKGRTRRLFAYIPKDKMEWTYQEGKFTIGDIIRHLANIERDMYAETVQNKPSRYQGCRTDYAHGYDAVIDFYNKMHEESVEIFSKLSPEDLQKKCKTPAGIEITTWKWLRAMAEHEIHHRGQIYIYLGMLGITTPPIYGLTSEEVIAKSSE